MSAVATATNDADEIRRQMALIRRELHDDVRGVVASAEAVTDWHRYIRDYPWVSLGAAAAVGFMIVPRKRRSVPRDVARRSDVADAVEQTLAKERGKAKAEEKEKTKRGLIGMVFGMLAPVAVRAAQGYAVQYLERWIAQQQEAVMAAHMGAARPPGSAGGHGPTPRPPGM